MNNDNWIPVEERLPEDDKEILAHIPDSTAHIQRVRYKEYEERESYVLNSNLMSYSISDVTHWQPLPTPPQTKKD